MVLLVNLLILAVILMAVIQLLIVGSYCRYMAGNGGDEDWIPESHRKVEKPPAAIVISVRGAEPALERNFQALLNQDYATYHLHAIVDHPLDSAYPILKALQQQYADKMTLHLLQVQHDRAGLKPMALSQACRWILEHAPDCQVIAFTDADCLQSHQWLSRLVETLQNDAEAGAVTGNRWYNLVQPATLGSRVRSLWNLASLPQMHLYRVVWGGSWAVDVRVLRHSDLLDTWDQTLFEDTLVHHEISKLGLQVRTVPGLYSISDDQTDLAGTRTWMFRQLLDLRLYHAQFPLVAVHAGVSAFMACLPVILGLLLLAAVAMQGQWLTVSIVGLLSCVIYQALNVLIWWMIDRTATRNLDDLGLPTDRTSLGLVQAISTLLATQLYYPSVAWSVLQAREVHWRGIHYRWNAHQAVYRLNYQVHDGAECNEPH